ncbi:tRNA pseudouridine(55) synthase TruB [Aciduricibacillus chroicocephali]|uniref:tRNA pseudouridine synthase B n=1 Tax=Aciduricibacillus chroicocephali TaxID=3054939 RepID=A0ABY9L1X3_9BACI|nr:tRNA pseudouridine(55) synthase TruB [Bacillaceae bacterium 44XB]
MDGILPLWKPVGMTSHDCVIKMRKLFKMKKVGHTGTLDPDAEGVLPICFGQATKIVPFLTDTKKTYIAALRIGRSTETEDASGATVEEKEVTKLPGREEIEHVLKRFTGAIVQIPPMYSAVKVNGKKLYEYARAGLPVERPSRTVHIDSLHIVPHPLEGKDCFGLEIMCSKGTYIRTLCVDIGKELGYPAHMAALERTQTGDFGKTDAVTFAMLEEAAAENRLEDFLLPMERGISHLPRIEVNDETCIRVKFGQKLPRPDSELPKSPFLMTHNDQVLAVYEENQKNEREIRPVRVFTEEQKSR